VGQQVVVRAITRCLDVDRWVALRDGLNVGAVGGHASISMMV
jgi:hypothetical protein